MSQPDNVLRNLGHAAPGAGRKKRRMGAQPTPFEEPRYTYKTNKSIPEAWEEWIQHVEPLDTAKLKWRGAKLVGPEESNRLGSKHNNLMVVVKAVKKRSNESGCSFDAAVLSLETDRNQEDMSPWILSQRKTL